MSSDSALSQISKIDTKRSAPFATVFMIGLTLLIFYWFFRGGSFRLYASVFFGLYFITRQIWVSVLLIGIIQNIAFLPLHFIWLKMSTSIKSFEDEIEAVDGQDEQYIVFQQKVKKGDFAASFYIFSFILNAIAFFSAGRVFLIDFYTKNLDPSLIYSFIPYPEYPLKGTLFHFPFFKVTQTTAVDWKYIIYFWLGVTIFFAVARLLWRFLKIFFAKNQTILKYRIGYNKILFGVGGVGLTLLVLSIIFLRHVPSSAVFVWLVADLTRQNSTMNLITAVGTFLTTVAAGFKNSNISAKNLQSAGVSQDVIDRITREKMRQSFKNAILLGIGAYFITSQIPSAFELSVATFEVLYIISPYTFDRFLTQVANKSTPKSTATSPETNEEVSLKPSEKN